VGGGQTVERTGAVEHRNIRNAHMHHVDPKINIRKLSNRVC
jgi:hypothetical protein